MLPLVCKIVTEILSVILKCIGEMAWHDAQRFILPAMYSISVSYESACWWLGLTTLPMIAPIDLGYKDYGKKDSVARALWLFVICIVAGLGPFLHNNLSFDLWFIHLNRWCIYISYITIAGFIGTLTRNINNKIEAPVTGLWICFLIWFIHPIINIAK